MNNNGRSTYRTVQCPSCCGVSYAIDTFTTAKGVCRAIYDCTKCRRMHSRVVPTVDIPVTLLPIPKLRSQEKPKHSLDFLKKSTFSELEYVSCVEATKKFKIETIRRLQRKEASN